MNAKPVRMLGVAGVALLAALSPVAASAHPSTENGQSNQASNALLLRSEALNHQLHLGGSGSTSLQASRALQVRSHALNQKLGLGASGNADLRAPDTRDAAAVAQGVRVPVSALEATTPAHGFDWTAAGIAAFGVAAASALVASASAAARRRPARLSS